MKKQIKLYKKRRIEGKTDYRKRLVLLKSRSPRFVVRKSNKYLMLQAVEDIQAQDTVVQSFSTKSLLKHGWPKEKDGSLKSVSAAYLGGIALGKKVSGKIKGRIILDAGLIPNTKGSRIYAAVKGFADAGMKIPFDEKVAPEKGKIEKFPFFAAVKKNVEGLK